MNKRPFPEVVDINPRRFTNPITDDDELSFVPMKAVEAESGKMFSEEIKSWSDVKKGYTPFENDDVLFAKITPCMENGKFALAEGLHHGRAAGSTEFHVFRAKSGLLPKYLLFFLFNPALRSDAKKNMRGAVGQLRVPIEFFENLTIPVPSPAEQEQIVSELERQFTHLDAGVETLRRIQRNLRRYRAAVLKAACEGTLVPTEAEIAKQENRGYETGKELLQRILTERKAKWKGRGKYKEAKQPDVDELPKLPKGWTWCNLEQVSWDSSYGTSAKCTYENTGSAVLRIPNIAGGKVNLDDLKFAPQSEKITTGNELQPGDLLIIRTNGSKNLIGRAAMIRTALSPKMNYASYLIRFRLLPILSLQEWIASIWSCPMFRNWIEMRAATSAGQHNISMTVLNTLPIPLPPLAEQTRIVAEVERRLSIVDEVERIVAANLRRAGHLKQSILKKAFEP